MGIIIVTILEVWRAISHVKRVFAEKDLHIRYQLIKEIDLHKNFELWLGGKLDSYQDLVCLKKYANNKYENYLKISMIFLLRAIFVPADFLCFCKAYSPTSVSNSFYDFWHECFWEIYV